MLKTFEDYKGFKDEQAYGIAVLNNHNIFLKDGKYSNHQLDKFEQLNLSINKSVFSKDYKLTFQFGILYGNFSISEMNLTTLEGCPEKLFGDFRCSFNDMLNLKGSPKRIYGDATISHNSYLTSLEGLPEEVHGILVCHNNRNLKSLYGLPKSFIYTNDTFAGTNVKPIEIDFAKYVSTKGYNNYFIDLLKFITEKDISKIGDIEWPENFLSENLVKSCKTLNKFNL